MILCREKKLAFVSTPKCGTHTMYYLLEKHCGGERYADYHHRAVPSYAMGWTILTTVRNPFDRAVSAWASILRKPGKRWVIAEVGGEGFRKFAKWLAKPRDGGFYPTIAIVKWLSDSNVKPRPMKLERLREELDAAEWYDGPLDLPVLNPTDHGPRDVYYNDEAAADVLAWAGADFEAFGYSTDWRDTTCPS